MPMSQSFRRRLLFASALSGLFAASGAWAQSGVPAAGSLGNSGPSNPSEPTFPNSNAANTAPVGQAPNSEQTIEVQKVRAEYKRLLLREKNSPSAVTELGARQIAQVGVQGSVATLLRQAPSVYVYQQGIGNNEPVISLRGTRGLETAQTLDDIPMQDLLNGGSGTYLASILGGRFNLDQISGVSIYPGVAYPDKNTFGTIGGTIAYDSLRPSPDRFVDVTGSVGSFGTYQEGFTLNSGLLDGPLGTGYDAPSFLLKYSNLSTQGFIDYTAAHYNNMEFAADKPYDDGLSKVQATVLYNTANGLFTPEPIPLPYLLQNGHFSNYSPGVSFSSQQNDYLSIFFKDRTYINPYLTVGGSLFYLPSDTQTQSYSNPTVFAPSGGPGSAAVDGANPFNQNPASFGEQGSYLPFGPFYSPPAYTYNGNLAYPPGSAGCPLSVSNAFAAAGQASPCGYNSQLTVAHTDTYGLQPRVTLTPPDIGGFRNTIIFGALIAKETEAYSPTYNGGLSQVTPSPANLIVNTGPSDGLSSYDGGQYRTIYQGFAQDKIDTLRNTLHVTPGFTFESTSTGDTSSQVFGGTPSAATLATPYCQQAAALAAQTPPAASPCSIGSYKDSRFDKEWLPFLNVTYDLDRILPAAKGTSFYGSYGESALFAPVGDFGPAIVSTPPAPSIVHLYEGGVRYDTSKFLLSADYYYQKVDRDFGFFTFQSGPQTGEEIYTNDGIRQFQGQELTAAWQIDPSWQLFLNGSHIRAQYLATSLSNVTIQQDQFGLAIRGTPISGIPNWISTFGVDYDKKSQFLDNDELHVRFEGQYTGQQFTTTDVTAGPGGLGSNIGPLPGAPPFGTYGYYNFSTGSTITNLNSQLPDFFIFNLDANYSMPMKYLTGSFVKKLDFDLNILNLFNHFYYQYFYTQISPSSCGTFPASAPKGYAGNPKNNYSCSPLFADGLPGEPFAATFTVTARF